MGPVPYWKLKYIHGDVLEQMKQGFARFYAMDRNFFLERYPSALGIFLHTIQLSILKKRSITVVDTESHAYKLFIICRISTLLRIKSVHI